MKSGFSSSTIDLSKIRSNVEHVASESVAVHDDLLALKIENLDAAGSGRA